ncbi:MAG: radical SAM protein [Thermodesulfovibrionales bacterium]|nr:radical SAM protein [Thermodesulfovibrionales bacterium]
MTLKVLLINPWIYDFSAYNMWAMPLGLLKTAEYLSQYDADISFIDCLKTQKTRHYNTGKYPYRIIPTPSILKGIKRHFKAYGITEEEFITKLKENLPVDVVLITTIMSYWYLGAKRVIEIVRSVCRDIPIILGGIYPTLYNEHAMRHCSPTALCIGKSEDSLLGILESIGYKLKRVRQYQIPYYELGMYTDSQYSAVLTSNGCPFRCIYCASYLLNDVYSQRQIDDVLKDISELHRKGVTDIAFYDDALLYDADNHIKPILRYISKKDYGINLHSPNGLHCRYIDEEVAYLFKVSGFKTIRLGYETFNKQRQSDTGAKTTDNDLITAVKNLKRHGFSKTNIGVYLMYGLPNQDLKEVKDGIGFLKSLNVQIRLTEFSPIKGTKAWQMLEDEGIIDGTLDPLLTNNTVFSEMLCSYDVEEIRTIKEQVNEYNRQIN